MACDPIQLSELQVLCLRCNQKSEFGHEDSLDLQPPVMRGIMGLTERAQDSQQRTGHNDYLCFKSLLV